MVLNSAADCQGQGRSLLVSITRSVSDFLHPNGNHESMLSFHALYCNGSAVCQGSTLGATQIYNFPSPQASVSRKCIWFSACAYTVQSVVKHSWGTVSVLFSETQLATDRACMWCVMSFVRSVGEVCLNVQYIKCFYCLDFLLLLLSIAAVVSCDGWTTRLDI